MSIEINKVTAKCFGIWEVLVSPRLSIPGYQFPVIGSEIWVQSSGFSVNIKIGA